ncbi:hypothetical protein HMPREF0379_0604 [[Eubacterium] yurii subsp. margaretiae ATCC 43715]|nr:hypothetical protein HMPREF0379_0604 [[Eubacterium] yurii subsp. margaretiae ATCC 43715]
MNWKNYEKKGNFEIEFMICRPIINRTKKDYIKLCADLIAIVILIKFMSKHLR